MGDSIQEALLKQQIEFLEMELQEFRVRHEYLQRVNDTLINALQGDSTQLKDSIISELEKTNHKYIREAEGYKQKFNDQMHAIEKDKLKCQHQVKDLELKFEQYKVTAEAEKLQLSKQLKELEADKFDIERKFDFYESDKKGKRDVYQYEAEIKSHEQQRAFEIEREALRNESLKVKQDSDNSILELKRIYCAEIENYKGQIRSLQDKIKKQRDKIYNSKENDKFGMLESKTRELDDEIATYRSRQTMRSDEIDGLDKFTEEISRMNDELQGTVIYYQSREQDLVNKLHDKDRQINYFRSRQNTERYLESSSSYCTPSSKYDTRGDMPRRMGTSSNHSLSDRRHEDMVTYDNETISPEKFHDILYRKNKEISELKLQVEATALQRDRVKVELDRTLLELRQIKMDHEQQLKSMNVKENGFKSEIKILIGKLLKAKSKLAAEGKLAETVKRDAMNLSRSRSTNRSRFITKHSSSKRSISPLNLSSISRSGSPFAPGDIDLPALRMNVY